MIEAIIYFFLGLEAYAAGSPKHLLEGKIAV